MGSNTITRNRSRKIYMLLVSAALLTAPGSMKGREVQADSQTQLRRQPDSAGPLVIQGRITGIQGTLLTVKTPDGYPGGSGGHAQFVTAGPAFVVEVSRARVLLPDGKQVDKRPLVVGDRVVIVLSPPDAQSPLPSPANVSQAFIASIIERIAQSDTTTTH